jgi:hypothetical protein
MVFSLQASARIYDSFICYTRKDMAVIHGIVGEFAQLSTVQIHYQKLVQNPLVVNASVEEFDRVNKSLYVTAKNAGQLFLELDMKSGQAVLNLDLESFQGGEGVIFKDAFADCYFGYVED